MFEPSLPTDPWEGLIDSIPVGVTVTYFPSEDPADGYLIAANRAANDVLGFDLAAFVGVEPADTDRGGEFDEKLANNSMQMSFDVAMGGQPIRLENFAIESGLGQGNYQATIFALPGRRSASVFRRTDAELVANEALGWAMRALEDANESLATFASAAAHDLKNPLAGIVGNAELAKMTSPNLSEEAAIALDRVIELSHASAAQIEDLLRFARAPSVNGTEAIELRAVVEWALRLLADQIAAVRAEVTVTGEATLLGNEAALRQVVLNLVSNSIRYRHGNRTLTIAIIIASSDGVTSIEVADNGIGIDQSMHEVIFGWGTRVDSSEAGPKDSVLGGSGVGLAASRATLRSLGGTLAVALSSVDGTVFRMALPASE